MSGDPGLTQPTSDPNFVDSNNVQMNGSAAMPSYDEFGNATINDNMVRIFIRMQTPMNDYYTKLYVAISTPLSIFPLCN